MLCASDESAQAGPVFTSESERGSRGLRQLASFPRVILGCDRGLRRVSSDPPQAFRCGGSGRLRGPPLPRFAAECLPISAGEHRVPNPLVEEVLDASAG